MCLSESEKKEVMDLLYKFKYVFGLRDEIGTYPDIDVEIDITDKSPFIIRPYYVKEEDKNILYQEMNRLCDLGILRGILEYLSLVIVISRKSTQDE